MEKIDSFQAAFYILAFIVPGFIWQSVLAQFIRQKDQAETVFLVRCFTLSCINYSWCSWIVYLLLYSQYFQQNLIPSTVVWSIVVLVSPSLMGVVSGLLIQRKTLTNWLSRVGVDRSSMIPAAWDV